MKTFIVLALTATTLAAQPALAQNISTVMQAGARNTQTTMQSGRNVATTTQIGNDNSATTLQPGRNTYSSIVQVGAGHERTNVLDQDFSAMGSVQVNALHSGATWDMSGGSAGGGIHLHFEVK